MKIKLNSSLIVSVVLFIFLLWVFNRPISSFGLFVYDLSGKLMSQVRTSLVDTQEEASDILIAQKKLKLLKRDNIKLRLENKKISSQIKKVDDLKKQLKYKKKFSFKTVAAKIIGRSPEAWHKQIILDKGSSDGVQVGRAVLSEKAVLGQVVKTSSNSSIVQLVFDRSFKMGAKAPRSRLYGVLSGGYPGPAFLDFIPVGSDIKVGDKVVSSGINLDKKDMTYPENYPIGEVVDVLINPDALDLIVKVRLFEDLTQLREVFVLK